MLRVLFFLFLPFPGFCSFPSFSSFAVAARRTKSATRERASAAFSRQSADPDLVALIWAKAPSHGLRKNFTKKRSEIVDDHRPFIDRGVPSIDIIDHARKTPTQFPPYWHTRDDTVDKLSASMLGKMGNLLLDVLQDPTFFGTWPQPRMVRPQRR